MLNFLVNAKKYVVETMSVIIAILLGWLYIEQKQKDVAQAEAGDQKDQAAINKLSADQAKNDGLNDAEAQKRIALEQQLEKVTNDKPDQDTILRVINTPDDQQ